MRWTRPRRPPPKETSSCCHPPARASTSTPISRRADAISRSWSLPARIRTTADEPSSDMPRAPRRRQLQLESNILLTATLCLLAAGAVMVFSASSARTVLQGQGDGTGYLVKYVAYGAVGFALMQVIARMDLQRIMDLTGPLLAVSFGLLVAVRLPGIGVEVNGARRWLGAGPLQFQPAEIMKVALVLYSAKVLADKPKRVRSFKGVLNPLGYVAGAAVLLVVTQPDLGTALV